MADPIKEGFDFFRSEFLALAFMGSLLAMSFWPLSDRKKAAVKVMAGVVISCFSTPAIIWGVKFAVPDFPTEGLYWVGLACFFWVGFLSSHIARAMAEAVQRLPRTKLPGCE